MKLTNLELHMITKNDSLTLKAIAIICITIHNFVHWTNSIGENELKLNEDRIILLLQSVYNKPSGAFNYIFSYFGWYFIVIFIFISAYGMILKIQNKGNAGIVCLEQIIKTAILLCVGGVFICLFTELSPQDTMGFIISKLATIDNLSYETVFSTIGPWWYFSLAIQLYLVIPVVLYLTKYINEYVLLVLSYFSIYVIYFNIISVSIFATAIGHIPEVLMAFILIKNNKKISPILFFISVCLFILSNINNYFFPFTYITFLIMALFIYDLLKGSIGNYYVTFVGIISPFIFILNGPMRTWTMKNLPLYIDSGYRELIITVSSLLHLLSVIIISCLFYSLCNKGMEWLKGQATKIA
ncbi:hypothetical protein [Morganella morganii]|uniref:hypothetical protein n=1 Tax=Morganella morganii TaxID=582 RepID=UPI001BDB2AC5|nr:hypothetical protein [Morganella morganii]MBT0386003.1 hypothetical protein [Morganella morganii subsp. morganii]